MSEERERWMRVEGALFPGKDRYLPLAEVRTALFEGVRRLGPAGLGTISSEFIRPIVWRMEDHGLVERAVSATIMAFDHDVQCAATKWWAQSWWVNKWTDSERVPTEAYLKGVLLGVLKAPASIQYFGSYLNDLLDGLAISGIPPFSLPSPEHQVLEERQRNVAEWARQSGDVRKLVTLWFREWPSLEEYLKELATSEERFSRVGEVLLGYLADEAWTSRPIRTRLKALSLPENHSL